MKENDITSGLRVLVVEDEALISLLLEDMIIELGAEFVGPCESVADALAAVTRDDFDVALVDLNLHGEPAEAVAQSLAKRGIPFAVASGSPENDIGLGQIMVVQKPFGFDDIETALQRLDSARSKSSS